MPTIRKITGLVSIFLLILVPLVAYEEDAKGGFSLSPLMGMIIGQSEEILYKYKNSDQYVSQLLWDLKPLFYLGIDSDFGPRDPFQKSGFIASGSVKFGLPLKTGMVEDRDWNDSSADYLTHYSRHDAYSQNAILTDLSAGYSWRIKDYLVLSACGKFSYMYFSWMAENGYYQYADKVDGHYKKWDESIPKKSVYGAIMRYIQHWFILAPVLTVKSRLERRIFFEGSVSYSPLIYCADRDDHFFSDVPYHGRLFYGYYSFGHYIDGNTRITFSASKNLDLSLSISYRYITGLRDVSFYAYTGADVSGNAIENYDGGTGYSALDINFATRIRLYGRR